MNGKTSITLPSENVEIDITPIMVTIQTLLNLAEYIQSIGYDESSETAKVMAHHIIQIKKYVVPKIDTQKFERSK